jgi:hypothetical protein
MESDREILLLGVLNQLDLTGKIDYKILARDIGAPSPGAAKVRWSRFRTKLRSPTGRSPKKPAGVQKFTKSPAEKVKWARKESSKVEDGGRADDEMEIEDVPNPVRRMPPRKARVADFKDELSDFEDEEENERCDEVMKLMEGIEEGSSSSGHSSGI